MGRIELAKGATGPTVEELQKLLNQNGAKLKADGGFGAKTEAALKDLQTSYGLKVTGKADAATWAILDCPPFRAFTDLLTVEMAPKPSLSGNTLEVRTWNSYGNLLKKMALQLGFPSAAAVAVLCIESAGKGFQDGKMIIRFENHIFYARWGKTHQALFDQHFRFNSAKAWTEHEWRADPTGAWRKLHVSGAEQSEEWAVLDFARTLPDAETSALESISMGAAQVMGFNHDPVSYPTAKEMFESWQTGDRIQVIGMFDFIRSNHIMIRSLRAKNWVGFATIYNGPGHPESYGLRIQKSYDTARKAGIP